MLAQCWKTIGKCYLLRYPVEVSVVVSTVIAVTASLKPPVPAASVSTSACELNVSVVITSVTS